MPDNLKTNDRWDARGQVRRFTARPRRLMPVEWSVAAEWLGRSMVRPDIQPNDAVLQPISSPSRGNTDGIERT